MTLLKRISLGAERVRLGWLPGGMRNIRTLGPLALALAIIAGGAILLGPMAHQRPSVSAAYAANAAPRRIARADVHVETLYNGGDLELNVAITQTQNDCQAPVSDGFCLRYSVVLDEEAVMVGYGVVPPTTVHVTPFAIALTVDTSKVPGFVNVVGSGGMIVMNWKTASPIAKTNVEYGATVQGGIGRFSVPSHGVLATIIMR